MKTMYILILMMLSSVSFAIDEEINLSVGETHMAVIQVNGDMSFDLRAGIIICDDTNQEKIKYYTQINKGRWPVVGMVPSESNEVTQFVIKVLDPNVRASSPFDFKEVKITCSHQTI